MRYKITKLKKGFRVKDTKTGQVKANRTTKKKAQNQVKILSSLQK